MKRLLCLILCLCLTLTAVGCAHYKDTPLPSHASGDSSSDPSGDVQTTNESPTPPFHAVSLPTASETTLAEDDTLLFTKTYQKFHIYLSDSAAAARITVDLESRLSATLADAAQIESNARTAYDPEGEWVPYMLEVSYTPTRLDQSVLSLFGNHMVYWGGVHPSLVTESVTYDLTTGQVLTLGDILDDNTSGSEVCELILEALAPRAENDLYDDHQEVLRERFSTNYQGLTEWYFSQTGLCFHFSPYDIAPYSSGTIIAEIPYASLSGILLEKYLPAEQTEPTGSMYAEAYQQEDSRFTNTASVELNANGTSFILYPDAPVADVRIESGHWSSDGNLYIATSTIFAADTLELGNAIVVTADLSDKDAVLRLVYRSGDLEVTSIVTQDSDGSFLLIPK